MQSIYIYMRPQWEWKLSNWQQNIQTISNSGCHQCSVSECVTQLCLSFRHKPITGQEFCNAVVSWRYWIGESTNQSLCP